MKIGIIGSGNIGGTLGTHWAKAGHEVLFSSRHPKELNQLQMQAGNNATAVSVEEAFVANADVYLLAMPFKEIDTIAELYAGEYGGKVIIDATNPYPKRDGTMAQEVRDSNSNASEYTATRFGTALTAKAFNTIYADDLKKKAFRDNDKIAIPFAAQDALSKETTQKLIEDIGMNAVYVGNLAATHAMEVDGEVYGVSTDQKELRSLLNLP